MAEKKTKKKAAVVKCRDCEHRMGIVDHWCMRAVLEPERERSKELRSEEPLDIDKERKCDWFEKRTRD